MRNSAWRNQHHLSLGQALAVYDVLLTQVRLPAQQLFVAGHGANHPLYSNATTPGKQRNARVELVIYPETVRKGP
jgi:flagellar motor protein MotB